MNVFIMTDLEGIHNVTSMEYMDLSTEAYQQARKALTESINKTAGYCLEAGAETIYYLDGHGGMQLLNVIEEELLPELIKVTHNDWKDIIIGKKVDCVIELGCHARAGTLHGFLDHTINSRTVFSHKINGREFSELALHAAFCGAYGIPIVGCSGDKTACLQAQEYVPQIHTAVVKEATCRNEAVPVENPYDRIRTMVHEALADYRNIEPFRVEGPVTVEVTYYRTDMCEEILAKGHSNVVRKDARTLSKVIDRIISPRDVSF